MLAEDRATASGAGLKEVMEIDFVGNLFDIANGDIVSSEILNAAVILEAVDQSLSFDYGLSLWNAFVFRFVPAQLLGQDFKKGLTIDFINPAYLVFRYNPHLGSTVTGMADAFESFWYFGAIKFFIIGLILSRWHRAAMSGSIIAQLIVMLTMTGGLHTVTHTTHHFFLAIADLVIFLVPVLLYARIGKIHRVGNLPAMPGRQ